MSIIKTSRIYRLGLLTLGIALAFVTSTACSAKESRVSPYVNGFSFTKQPTEENTAGKLSCTFYTFITTKSTWKNASGEMDFLVRWRSKKGSLDVEVYKIPWKAKTIQYQSITTDFVIPSKVVRNEEVFWVEVEWKDATGRHIERSKQMTWVKPSEVAYSNSPKEYIN